MLMSVMGRPGIIKDAGRVTEDFVTTFESAGRRFPATGKASR